MPYEYWQGGPSSRSRQHTCISSQGVCWLYVSGTTPAIHLANTYKSSLIWLSKPHTERST